MLGKRRAENIPALNTQARVLTNQFSCQTKYSTVKTLQRGKHPLTATRSRNHAETLKIDYF